MTKHRGRPQLVTPPALLDAAIAAGLPAPSIRAVAKHLGVSEMSVYRHVGNLQGLLHLLTNELYSRLEVGPPSSSDPAQALADHARTLRQFIEAHPGCGPLLSQVTAQSPTALRKIGEHHQGWAAHFGWPPHLTAVVLGSVSQHAIALAAVAPAPAPQADHAAPPADAPAAPTAPDLSARIAANRDFAASLGDPFDWSMARLIEGVVAWLSRHT